MEYCLHIFVITGIYIILTLSLNLIVGFTGLAALGHIAFACVGAYTSSLLALNYGLSPWIGLLIGAILASVLVVIIGYPSLRLKGDYLALATFGLGIIVYSIAKNESIPILVEILEQQPTILCNPFFFSHQTQFFFQSDS